MNWKLNIAAVLCLAAGLLTVKTVIAERNYAVVKGNMTAGVIAAYCTVVSSPSPKPLPVPKPGNKIAVIGEKLSFVEFGAVWCPACQKLKVTLEDAAVKQALSEYNVYTLDADKDKELARKYGVRSIPAYFLVKSDGTVVNKDLGYKTPSQFIDWLGQNKISSIGE